MSTLVVFIEPGYYERFPGAEVRENDTGSLRVFKWVPSTTSIYLDMEKHIVTYSARQWRSYKWEDDQ